MKKIENRKSKIENARAFTLIELLVVIAVIAVIAGFTFPVLKGVKITQFRRTASGELEQIAAALDNYKAKYGFYPPANTNNSLLPPLYSELVGTRTPDNGATFFMLNGSAASPPGIFYLGGYINCTKASGEDAVVAKNFLPGLKQNRIGVFGVTNVLITSVRGPDAGYMPMGVADVNPFRYRYPGTNNPNSYDLWLQLVISGKTNLICNWSRQVQINSSLP